MVHWLWAMRKQSIGASITVVKRCKSFVNDREEPMMRVSWRRTQRMALLMSMVVMALVAAGCRPISAPSGYPVVDDSAAPTPPVSGVLLPERPAEPLLIAPVATQPSDAGALAPPGCGHTGAGDPRRSRHRRHRTRRARGMAGAAAGYPQPHHGGADGARRPAPATAGPAAARRRGNRAAAAGPGQPPAGRSRLRRGGALRHRPR